MAAVPTVEEIRAWLKLAETSMSDEQLGEVRDAELELQAIQCRLPEGYPDDPDLFPMWARMAIYRRCARHVAAKGIPLGIAPGDEYGPQRLPNYDAEIQRLERPRRKFVAG